jgi:hypothetical protein
VISNINNQVVVVNNKNMPGSAEAQPGTKAGGVVLSGGSIAPFAFMEFETGIECQCEGGGGFWGAAAPHGFNGGLGLFDDIGNDKPAFGVNLPPLRGRGGDNSVVEVLKECGNFEVRAMKDVVSERLVKDKNNSNKLHKNKRKVTYHKHCGKWVLYTTNGEKSYFTRYRCKSWRCKKCSVDLAQKQFRKIQASLESMKYAVFLTLTFDGKELTNDKAEEKEGKMWNALKIYLERKFGKFEYYWTREWQVNTKMLHKHVLITGNRELWEACAGVFNEPDAKREMRRKTGQYYDVKKWINEVVVGRGYGKICDLARPRSNDAVIKYIVSEVTKTNQKKDDYRRNLRMYGSSKNFFKRAEKPEREKMDVFIIKGKIEDVKECLEGNGFITGNVMDDIVFDKNAEGKIEAVGTELGSFCVETG